MGKLIKTNSKNNNTMLLFQLAIIPVTLIHWVVTLANVLLVIAPRFLLGIPLGFLWTLNDIDFATSLLNLIPIIGWAKFLIYVPFAMLRYVPFIASVSNVACTVIWHALIANSNMGYPL